MSLPGEPGGPLAISSPFLSSNTCSCDFTYGFQLPTETTCIIVRGRSAARVFPGVEVLLVDRRSIIHTGYNEDTGAIRFGIKKVAVERFSLVFAFHDADILLFFRRSIGAS